MTSPAAPSEPKISIYQGSTQFRNWRYSAEQLAQTRQTLNEVAIAAIRKTFETDESGSSQGVAFLTADEEVLLVKLYISKITQLCGLFRFPEEVEATAVTYLKRFYLKNTVMDWHPKNVMLTALFLATKTTNNPISLEIYTTHIPKTSPSDVLDLEFLVAQSLNFEFAIWHAHRALWGLWLDIQNLSSYTERLDTEIYDAALNHVRASRLTDVELRFSPSQIALASLSLIQPELASQWMESKLTSPSEVEGLAKTVEVIKSIVVSQGLPPSVESVREVDRRLRLCKNPEKVPGTKAFLARKMDDDRLAAEKRSKKVADIQRTENGDPFGNELGQKRGLVDYDDDDDDD
ncbi:cyclin-like protein [Crepidotus variabilis]|uniref:Cyclin-like protein n=1 Tax=Crepidotus variabilis TaxID=179855 RepID=A0A9P6ELP9_9AGAR|nr:cyclin-like protein [Crepidotus variabilis]